MACSSTGLWSPLSKSNKHSTSASQLGQMSQESESKQQICKRDNHPLVRNGKEWQITLPMKETRSPWLRTSHTSPNLCSQSADNCVPLTCFLLPLAVTQQKILCWESPRKVPNRLTYAKEPYLTASKRRLGYCKSSWWETKLIHPFWRDQLTRWLWGDINFRDRS